nr:cytoplasmic protein [Tissierella sp.]
MKKIAFFPFMEDKMCFMHILINALDLHEKGVATKIIVEGKAVKLIKVLEEEENKMYLKTKELGLFDSICKACSAQMGVLEYNEKTGIPIKGNANGHPAMYDYISEGYDIVTL